MKKEKNSGEPDRIFPSASEDAERAEHQPPSPQTLSPSYKLAFTDLEFLERDELRGVRLQLEFNKPDLWQQWNGVKSTIVIFGSSRIADRPEAERRLTAAQAAAAEAPQDAAGQQAVKIAEQLLSRCDYYDQARELGRLISSDCQNAGLCNFVVTTGGGPGIMEAANRGAFDVQAKSIGLNIVLAFEQVPNDYITPGLCFQFHYFAMRKMHFLLRAKALVCFPGGFGTMDELFEALTLVQTRKVERMPILLVGKEYWSRAVNFEFFAEQGTISPEDLNLFHYVESAREAWDYIRDFYKIQQTQKDS